MDEREEQLREAEGSRGRGSKKGQWEGGREGMRMQSEAL